MIVVGIDPGLDGGYAIFDGNHCIVAGRLHYTKKIPDMESMFWYIFDEMFTVPDIVVCEQVHSTPNDGHVGAFTFGMGYGYIRGFCDAKGLKMLLVRPAQWKRAVIGASNAVPKMAIKTLQKTWPKYNPKDKAINKAPTLVHVHEKYPHIDLTPGRLRLPHDGIADAVALGEYGVSHA